ncbi:GNAT family N-acetyltransferase [Hydrogenophaga sp. PBL-H3]|uniref:GNAT family N-acetyltransferase n=1 Tax=Hydrogenophaga sp. PBL-H3 TaxID=434010 RepID=UPI00131FCB0A|nr:GNAT family N-acetyltransferase [Hydrogenophaga sp. PBL-H3]QHE77920.1 GNAT family N-acetyltransferase [Hydrogenophaga sp. PBL-H3]QHE82344.1 GNAT family N-acetyltransferase [Hydrogenophaga sp. PBL-H3]
MVDSARWFKSATPPAQGAASPAVPAPAGAARVADDRAFPSTSVVVPIRSIGPGQRDRILGHLLALEPHDRYLRFGYAANEEQITRYVDQLNFERDELFGIFNRNLDLIAMAHLAFSIDPQYTSCAEFGVSVAKSARGRGYGSRLFERAVMHARNEGVTQLFIHALSENTAMLKIARHAGAIIERDGSESEAHLRLPPADFDSRVTEMVNQQVALTDYHLKAQAKQFWSVLAMLQDIRQGVREARERVRG